MAEASNKTNSPNNGLILHEEHWKSFLMLADDQLGSFVKAMICYNRDHKEITLEDHPYIGIALPIIVQTMDNDRDKYIKRCETNSQNASKRGCAAERAQATANDGKRSIATANDGMRSQPIEKNKNRIEKNKNKTEENKNGGKPNAALAYSQRDYSENDFEGVFYDPSKDYGSG